MSPRPAKEWVAQPVTRDGELTGEWEVVIPDASKPTAEDPWYLATVSVHDACDELLTEETARKIAAIPALIAALQDAPCPSSMGTAQEHYQRFYDWLGGPAKDALRQAGVAS